MITAQAAIHRARRDLALGLLLKGALATALVLCLVIGDQGPRLAMLSIVAVVWFVLQLASARGSRLAASSPLLIASGQFEEAERQIDEAVRAFSVFRAAKMQALQYLAQLRHAQRRWQDSALLCRAVLGQRRGRPRQLEKPCRLILADALLELDQVNGAWEAMSVLYAQRLSLNEVLNLQLVQLDYSSRIGGWGQMFDRIATKVQLAELMPAPQAAPRPGVSGELPPATWDGKIGHSGCGSVWNCWLIFRFSAPSGPCCNRCGRASERPSGRAGLWQPGF